MRPSDPSPLDGAAQEPNGRSGLPKRFGRGLAAGIVGAILIVGLTASAVLYMQADRIAEDQEQALAARSSRILQSSSAALVASVAGASAIVDDAGTVNKARFERFATGTVDTTLLPVLAYVEVVTDDERAAFESELGKPIAEVQAGKLVPAAHRDQYFVVRYVYPESPTSTSVLGFDISSEPIRAAAAQAALSTGTTVFSAPITSQPSGQLGFFAVQPLFRPGLPTSTPEQRREAFAGFVSSLAPAKTILTQILDQLPDGAKVAITDSGRPLAGTASAPHNGHHANDTESGRLWSIEVEYHNADNSSVWLLLISTLVLAVSASLFLWRNVRQTVELRETAMGVRQLGLLSEQLAMAVTREEVIAVIHDAATSTVGAASASVALPGDDPGTLVAVGSTGPRQVLTVSVPSPITDAWNTKNAVFINDETAFRGLYADGAQDRADRNVASMAALPMRRPTGELLGVLAWEWPTASRFGHSLRSRLQATAEVCQQSVFRADLHEQQWAAASAMSALSQRLAVTRNVRQIADAVVELGPAAGGADFVGVGFLDEAASRFDLFFRKGTRGGMEQAEFPFNPNGGMMTVLRKGQPIEFQNRSQLDRFPLLVQMIGAGMKRLVCIPLIDSEGQLRGVMAFVFTGASPAIADPGNGRLSTIAELTAQTVERAMLYLHEHELVVNLQRQTLADLPDVEGLQMAARYLPSSATLGLGGDWYDVYVLDDGRIGLVVGDVSGHGIDAIADMTEFRTTVSTLLRTNQELSQIAQMSSGLLRGDHFGEVRFATAGLMVYEPTVHSLSYVRAGHPPMLIREPGGNVVVLEHGGGGPLGITDGAIDVQTVAVESGSVIVAYTDGLIERRDESIDTGLDRLCRALADCSPEDLWQGAEAIADALIERCLGDRQTADDAALLVVVVQ